MKNFKSIIAAITLCFATSFLSFASSNHDSNPGKESVRTQILHLLGTEAPFAIPENSQAEVVFTVNDENEMIIIEVKSENEAFENYVKRKLDHKKLHSDKLKARTLYTLPVQLKNI